MAAKKCSIDVCFFYILNACLVPIYNRKKQIYINLFFSLFLFLHYNTQDKNDSTVTATYERSKSENCLKMEQQLYQQQDTSILQKRLLNESKEIMPPPIPPHPINYQRSDGKLFLPYFMCFYRIQPPLPFFREIHILGEVSFSDLQSNFKNYAILTKHVNSVTTKIDTIPDS